MTKLSLADIIHISKLARIELSEQEQKQMVQEIGSILAFVDNLQKIDVGSVNPTSQVTGLTDVWRDDEVVDCTISRDELLSQTPATQDGYIKVKKVL